jgi:hypothetical protein
MWDPSQLFETRTPLPVPHPAPDHPSVAPATAVEVAPEKIDLRVQTIDVRTAPGSPRRAPQPHPEEVLARRRALLASVARSKRGPAPQPPQPSIGEALRDLNEQRLVGTISEDEFKARKAELFS